MARSSNLLGTYPSTRLEHPNSSSQRLQQQQQQQPESDVTAGQTTSILNNNDNSSKQHISVSTKSFDTSTEISETSIQAKISELVATSTRCKVTNTKDDDFNALLGEVMEAIGAGIHPQLIAEGSSGSYFVYNKHGKTIGIFKPKDEEPFADLNPKWPKYFQKILCFCCFGRSCLIPNVGYLSETAASLVDERLNLFVVPKTRVVKLASPSFNYGRHWLHETPKIKGKEGSLQTFVHGYQSADVVLAEWASLGTENTLTPENEERFTLLFQKMCVLDYAIRNTDRHLDNWLVRHVPDEPIQVAVIDNGLAFPVKHPECASRFRTFPFAWGELSWAQKPLNPNLRQQLLNLLTPVFVHKIGEELKKFFRHDREHNRYLTYSQIRVFRGQLWNLKEGLEANESPSEWVKREPIIATRRFRHSPPVTGTFEDCFRRLPADYSHRGCC
uniref:Phosphatidylinositol 4-kinase type 2 n=1 Tax=Panagrolaimus superbus TaxID=310955 RepID=A0A914YU03_9BILA